MAASYFRPLTVVKRPLVGFLGEDVEPGLHRGIDAEFQDAPGRLGVEAAAQGFKQAVQRCGNR